MTHDRILPGVALMLGFCLVAPLIDVASKLAVATLPVGQVTAGRFLVQAALMAPVCLWMGFGLRVARRHWGALTLRAACLILSTYCFVAALTAMPVADALAIVFVEPFIILVIGHLWFGDEVGPRRIAASGIGFLGALLVIQPSFATFGPIALFPLGTAVFFALYMLVTRGLSREMHPVPMQFHTATFAMVLCFPVIIAADGRGWPTLDPVMPEGIAWIWLAGVGVASAVAHMMMTYALRFAPSATLAPLHYLEIVSAATLGYLVFSDWPNALTWSGIAVIVASGLYIIHREQVTARHRVRTVVLPPTGSNRPPA